MDDEISELRNEVKKLTVTVGAMACLQALTLRYLGATRAELLIQRAVIADTNANQNMVPVQHVIDTINRQVKQEFDAIDGMIIKRLVEMGFGEPPPYDPYWDRPPPQG